ncbi:hypothetical protein KIW84_054117 [Lathyrus oleraceus]|uniref:Uncharacterized protein n=1 Tax=Pisum sativum TaxID=3888 RepID=A0A9D5AJP6_PEA|nr:hypothetical protein KIW84_054117 [Pisum sativum]
MSQSSVSTPSKHSKEKSNPKNLGTEIDLYDVITNVVPLSIFPVHTTPMRKVRTLSSRKGKPSKSMTSLYLHPINIEPNVDVSKDCPIMTNDMEDVEASETNNRPRSVTTLSKSNMIVADRDDIDKNICVLIFQVLGIDPQTNVVSDVSTSLAPDNNIENPKDKPDVNALTLSPMKSQDKERFGEMTNEQGDKDKNPIEKNDQPTDLVNVEELDSDDVPIGKRLAPGIPKRLKKRKGQVVGSSSTPSKSVKNKASVDPTKRWSKVVTPVSKKKLLKRKEVPSKPSEYDHYTRLRPTNRTCILVELKDTYKTLDENIKSCNERKNKIEMLIKALSKEEGGLKSDGTDEEEENEDGSDASDDEDATNSDED